MGHNSMENGPYVGFCGCASTTRGTVDHHSRFDISSIPIYGLYWLYRAHGEITSMAPSRTILSPRASVIMSSFVPLFSFPVMMTTLNDALNKHAAKLGKPAYRASWVVCLWSFVFFPVSMAFVQSTMNSVMSEINQQQAV